MSWAAFDDDRLVRELMEFTREWIYHDDYKSRLPKQHIHVLKQGDKQEAGVNIVFVIEDDPEQAWMYTPSTGPDAGIPIQERFHRIAIVLKSDKKSGGTTSMAKVHGVVNSIFSCLEGSPERTKLITRGISNLMPSPEGISVDPGSNDEEGTYYSQAINLTCNTDKSLNSGGLKWMECTDLM